MPGGRRINIGRGSRASSCPHKAGHDVEEPFPEHADVARCATGGDRRVVQLLAIGDLARHAPDQPGELIVRPASGELEPRRRTSRLYLHRPALRRWRAWQRPHDLEMLALMVDPADFAGIGVAPALAMPQHRIGTDRPERQADCTPVLTACVWGMQSGDNSASFDNLFDGFERKQHWTVGVYGSRSGEKDSVER